MARELTPQQRQFVASYLGGATATQAAIDAGYSAHSAKSRAHVLLSGNKLIRAEIERVQQRLAKTADYNAEKCAAFIDTRIARAEADKQHSAAAKYHEQKMKLFGLLIDKQHIAVEQVDLTGALAEAKARLLRPRCDPALAIEGEFEALPRFAGNRPIDEQSVAPSKSRAVPRETERAIWHDLKPSFHPNERR